MKLRQALAAEFTGTAFLLMAVVGSGIMGERLAGGNAAIALLANSLATGGALVALILVCGPISGAHFNPLVSSLMALRGDLPVRTLPLYLLAQIAGALAGVVAAHAMFELPLVQLSTHARSGGAQMFSEFVATFGLLTLVLSLSRSRAEALPYAVASYIIAAYWFTASTSFANPAVTLARALTDTFSGIRMADIGGFVAAQCAGAVLAGAFYCRKPHPPLQSKPGRL